MGTSWEQNLKKKSILIAPLWKGKKKNLFLSTFCYFIGYMHILFVDMGIAILWA
jgi:hypothetical protein